MKRVVLTILALLVLGGLVFAAGSQQSKAAASGPVEISWFVNEDWYSNDWDLQKPVHAFITDKFGVTINFQNSAGGGTGTEKINAMIAADDLPDILSMGNWYTQFQDLMAAGMLQPLDEVIPKYTPAFWEQIPDFMVSWYKHTDGHWYGFPNFFWAKEQFNDKNFLTTNAGMVARKDIMDQLGITADDFKTQSGMLNALRKVRDAHIKYNGLDVVPLYFTPNGGFPETWVWTGMFAVPREKADGSFAGGEFGSAPLEDPKSFEILQFANQLYREGLLSRENWTADRSQISEKIVSGSIFALMMNVADYQNQVRDLYTADNSAKMVPVGPLHAQDGAQPELNSSGLTGWLVSMIGHKSTHLDKILPLWQWLYSKEGLMTTEYGFEGDTYTLDANGRVQWTQKYLDLVNDPNVSATAKIGNENLWLLINPVISQQVQPPAANEGEQLGRDITAYFGPYVFNDTAFGNLGPFGGTDESVINADIGVYMQEQMPKLILADSEAELRALYQETIDHLKAMGIDQVRAAQNEQFQLNKAKVGQEFAWPPLQ